MTGTASRVIWTGAIVVVAQTAALDKAVAALVGSLPAASASLIAERAKADQPSKDTLAAAAVVASHDAAVAAEAAAAASAGPGTASGLPPELEAKWARIRACLAAWTLGAPSCLAGEF